MPSSSFDVLRLWIQDGEHLQQDFKEKITSSQKIAKTVVAFANSKGGNILVGVKDTGGIVGVDVVQEKFMIETAINQYIYPKIVVGYQVLGLGKKQVLVVKVPEGIQKPYYSLVETGKNTAFVRIKDQVLMATPVHIAVMKRRSAGKNTLIKYTDLEHTILDFLTKNSSTNLTNAAQICNIPLWKAATVLTNLVCAGVIGFLATETEDLFYDKKNYLKS